MDFILRRISSKCVIKTPLVKSPGKIAPQEILHCMNDKGRFIIFPIHHSSSFYVYDKTDQKFEQFNPDPTNSIPTDAIFTASEKLSNLMKFREVASAENFSDVYRGYYYAFMRLRNPDKEKQDVLDQVANIENIDAESFEKLKRHLDKM